MSFCLRPNVCKKCGKPLTLFEGWTCFECDKTDQWSKTEWIPCSEDLPTDNGWYQCTVALDGGLSLTMDLYYKNGKWLDNRRINMFDTYDIYGYGNTTKNHKLSYQELISEFDWTANVTAWMPLPIPYKSESEE